MQPYLDPTRKTTSKKNEKQPKKKWKWKMTSKKMKMEDDLNFKAVLLSWFNNKHIKNKWFWHHRDWPSFVNKVNSFNKIVLFGQIVSNSLKRRSICHFKMCGIYLKGDALLECKNPNWTNKFITPIAYFRSAGL